jgi:hypothetical protein
MQTGCGMRRAVFYIQMQLGIFVYKIPKPENAEQMLIGILLLTAPKAKNGTTTFA